MKSEDEDTEDQKNKKPGVMKISCVSQILLCCLQCKAHVCPCGLLWNNVLPEGLIGSEQHPAVLSLEGSGVRADFVPSFYV